MATDWDMPRRSDNCTACRKTFDPGDSFKAYLFDTPEGYQRRDFCLTCIPPDKTFSIGSWTTRRPLPADKKIQTFDQASIFQLFMNLADNEAPQKMQLRFVIALLLWRKKKLKLVGTIVQDDREIWRYTLPKTNQHCEVARPDLDEEQLERLGVQLELLISGEITDIDSIVASSNEETTTNVSSDGPEVEASNTEETTVVGSGKATTSTESKSYEDEKDN